MNKHLHSITTPCSTLSAAWQAEYRSFRSDNKGVIGSVRVDEGDGYA